MFILPRNEDRKIVTGLEISRDETPTTAKFVRLRIRGVGSNGASALLDDQELDDLITALTFYRQRLDKNV